MSLHLSHRAGPGGPERGGKSPTFMKRSVVALLLFSLALAACQNAGGKAGSPSRMEPSTPTEVSPVYASALCTLMGLDSRSEVSKDRPVIVMWGWSAATMDQIRDYIDAAIVKVTFDGKELSGRLQKNIPFDDTSKIYRAVWMAGVGIPAPGLHVITYSLEFRHEIFDGTDYYGPGTKNDKLSDRCEIDVK
jgi:hypothetical protein